MGVVCLLLGLLGVAWGIPAVNRASVLQSAGSADPSPSPEWGTPSDDSCVSISSSANDYWCQTNCAVGVCPDAVCQCGPVSAKGAQSEDAATPAVNLIAGQSEPSPAPQAGLFPTDPSCVSVSPSANDYWCQTVCKTGRCPPTICKCDSDAADAEEAAPASVPEPEAAIAATESTEPADATASTEATSDDDVIRSVRDLKLSKATTSKAAAKHSPPKHKAAKHSDAWNAKHASSKHLSTKPTPSKASTAKHGESKPVHLSAEDDWRGDNTEPFHLSEEEQEKYHIDKLPKGDVTKSVASGTQITIIGPGGEDSEPEEEIAPPPEPEQPSQPRVNMKKTEDDSEEEESSAEEGSSKDDDSEKDDSKKDDEKGEKHEETAAETIRKSVGEGIPVTIIDGEGEMKEGETADGKGEPAAKPSASTAEGPPKDPVDPDSCTAISPGATDAWCVSNCQPNAECPEDFCKCSRVITKPP